MLELMATILMVACACVAAVFGLLYLLTRKGFWLLLSLMMVGTVWYNYMVLTLTKGG